MIAEAGLPRALMAAATLQPALALQRCAGASRARAIRLRIRTWRRVRDLLLCMHGVPWPESSAQIVDYVEVRAAEPCGRTMPRLILSALGYLEERGEVPVEHRISRTLFFIHTVDELTAMLPPEVSAHVEGPGDASGL